MATILCVDDDPSVCSALEGTLRRAGHTPIIAPGVPDALREVAKGTVDLIISDYQMPGLTGLEFLTLLAGEGYDVPVIMLTGYASINHAVAAVKAGAIEYLQKPFEREQLELAVAQALAHDRLRRENETLRREVTEFRQEREIIGESVEIRKVLQTISMAARTRATVLVEGESGTGKELFARALHEQSDRSDGPFIKLNCAALPEGLIESALFGHERGAFSGAVRRVEGAFERAHRGTLLLDEISEMRLDLQSKLLRVLQEQEFDRVGGTSPVQVDVRIIATTNRDLAAEAEAGRFRLDLFYRLSVVSMRVPPLRERREDIPLLATRFSQRAAVETGKEIQGFAPEALDVLERLDWPGNVRQLQHAVERAVILSTEPVLRAQLFDTERSASARRAGTEAPIASPPVPALPPGAVVLTSLDVGDAERVLIQRALDTTGGNRTRAAKLLGISVRTLRNKLNIRVADDEPASDEELGSLD
jgi:DNA-binding NtrC family response regulator